MKLDINPTTFARALSQFVQAQGGTAVKHGESLEFLAKSAGFASYRAMKACAEDPEELSTSTRTVVDWAVAENDPEAVATGSPRLQKYKLEVEEQHNGLVIAIVPEHCKKVKDFEGDGNALGILVEINHGVPACYLTHDVFGDNRLAVFGTQQGLVVREEHNGQQLQRVIAFEQPKKRGKHVEPIVQVPPRIEGTELARVMRATGVYAPTYVLEDTAE